MFSRFSSSVAAAYELKMLLYTEGEGSWRRLRTHMAERKNQLPPAVSNLYMHTQTHTT